MNDLEKGAIIDISKAERIPGWMGIPELEWLASKASRREKIVEVGCWRGRTTRALADNAKGKVWAVDTWAGNTEHHAELAEHSRGWLWNEFRNNTRDLDDKLYICVGFSTSIAQTFAENGMKVDMVFLDAAHDYRSVKADILAWRPLLSNFGLLAGHDYADEWPGVRKAVTELIPRFSLPVGSIWVAE